MNFKFNDRRTERRSRLWILAATSFFLICATLPAGAAMLDAQAAKKLASDQMWQIKFSSGAVVFWSWRSNGTMCARKEEKNSDCIDDGTWKLDGNRLCYELTWFGKAEGLKSHCFRVEDQGAGHYVALSDNGLTFFEFSIAK